jgi:hypothetical protein
MRVERELIQVPMRPDDVLAAIRESYRFAAELDPESESGIVLTRDSAIAEWRRACDLVGARALGHALNEWFGVAASEAEWRDVLEPPQQARLAGVCDLVAAKGARRPVPGSAHFAGGECAAGGAFLTLRTLLAREGINVRELRPSTPLSALAGRHLVPLVTIMGKLAPNVLPVPRIITSRLERLSAGAFGICLTALLFAGAVDSPWYLVSALVGMILAAIGLYASQGLAPERYEFAEPATLGAVARVAIRNHEAPT